MKTAIDPRIQARRKEVREHGARRGLRRMIGLTLLLALAGGAVWLHQSEYLDVDAIVVSGAVESDPAAALASKGIIAGQPILLSQARAGRAEKAIRDDPWVRDAVVRVELPDTIAVEVLEYQPAAWANSSVGWLLLSPEGAVLLVTPTPGTALPHLDVGVTVAEAGSVLDSEAVLGALEFAAALPPSLQPRAVIELREEELWAEVEGYTVRLGGPRSMGEKAAAITALLEHGIDEGSEVNLVAPTRPAIMPLDTVPFEPESPPIVEGEG